MHGLSGLYNFDPDLFEVVRDENLMFEKFKKEAVDFHLVIRRQKMGSDGFR